VLAQYPFESPYTEYSVKDFTSPPEDETLLYIRVKDPPSSYDATLAFVSVEVLCTFLVTHVDMPLVGTADCSGDGDNSKQTSYQTV
jgi:hypothetical protein